MVMEEPHDLPQWIILFFHPLSSIFIPYSLIQRGEEAIGIHVGYIIHECGNLDVATLSFLLEFLQFINLVM
jgi:hypothetical protein